MGTPIEAPNAIGPMAYSLISIAAFLPVVLLIGIDH